MFKVKKKIKKIKKIKKTTFKLIFLINFFNKLFIIINL
jgi:hypothetical protein